MCQDYIKFNSMIPEINHSIEYYKNNIYVMYCKEFETKPFIIL